MTQHPPVSATRLQLCVGTLLIASSISLAGCGKSKAPSDDEKAPSRNAAPASMPGMPGMTTSGATKGEPAKESGATPSAASDIIFSAAQVQHGGVRWGPVTMGSAAGTAAVPGELSVNEDRTSRLGAPGRGRIIAVRVQPGDRVAHGQVLVTMQSADAGMAQSDVAKATAEVTSRRAQGQYAGSARARAERLLALKAIPRQDYERAIADDEQARAALQQSEAELRRARSTASLMGASGASASGEIVLRSPLSGVVLARPAQPGAVVDAGAPLVTVTDASSLWLLVKAPEQLSALFRRGNPLRFTVSAYPSDSFTGRTEAVGAGLDPETRTLSVRAIVANANGRLKPEMLATVQVEGGQRTSAALVPEAAIQLIDGKPTVFIAHPDAKGGVRFERRQVEVGSRTNGQVAVLRGLAAGDVVVTAGAFAVKAELQKGSMSKMEM
jgi:cobalt-zinc-cadmium efflux system membrane fusion protein